MISTYHGECHVVSLDPNWVVPPLLVKGKGISNYFSDASSALGSPAIRLEMSIKNAPFSVRGAVSAFQLHQALRQLTNNPPVRGQQPVPNIGLLFADSYEPMDGVFGIMFDRGFKTDTDHDTIAFDEDYAVPREGCAVFLGTILKYRQSDNDGFLLEAAYTAIHELGHVFNLVHEGGDGTFMAQSAADHPPPVGYLHFSDEQKRWLSQCGISSMVWPGGQNFRDIETWSNRPSLRKSAKNSPLRLHAKLDRREVWAFEPVELTVRLTIPRGNPSIQIPHRIDPGYDCFSIWIEDPDRSLRRYRPMRHYCSVWREFTVEPNKPFERDISIFAQAGGYTFRSPGEHRIWVELMLNGQRIRSKAETLFVKQYDSDSQKLRFLSEPQQARILYHRCSPLKSKGLDVLREFVAKNENLPVLASVHYAVGRTLANHALQKRKSDGRRRMAGLAIEHLLRAYDHNSLGSHARSLAEKNIELLRALD